MKNTMIKTLFLISISAVMTLNFPKYSQRYVFTPSKYPDDNYFQIKSDEPKEKPEKICEFCDKCNNEERCSNNPDEAEHREDDEDSIENFIGDGYLEELF
tara:strand:+ start:10584 stop:10883 length:300 start_codon:yes stop_codon:yes gene_type:complete